MNASGAAPLASARKAKPQRQAVERPAGGGPLPALTGRPSTSHSKWAADKASGRPRPRLTTLLTPVSFVVMGETTLYLRGMPTQLVREAKAAAARRGLNLAGLFSEALERSLSGDRGSQTADRGLEESRRWYLRHRERLRARYPGEYVAIVGRAVVDHGRSFEALASRVFARFGARPVWMPRVEAEEARARVRSPRRLRP